ncbi:MAG: phosphotransferase [Firmicutes bacterium]|nr:phosphotransferase [Bacillota bacterium]
MNELWAKAVSEVTEPENISRFEEIKAGGSERSFYRLFARDGSTYILQESKKYDEFQEYILIGEFFLKWGISVPRILSVLQKDGIAVIEDVGAFTIQAAARKYLQVENYCRLIELYKRILLELIKLQRIPVPELPIQIRSRRFDFDYYRWETDYFLQNCALKFFSSQDVNTKELNRGFASLAASLQEEPMFAVHRDFQSQNILLDKEEVEDGRISIIDFQSSRLGSCFYDVASLLKDPYVELPADIHDQLFDFYLKELQEEGIRRELSPESARVLYNRVSLQRLMQALGAYGNLGINKGKKEFLQYIPPAARLLYSTLEELDSFPNIRSIAERLFRDLARFFKK